MDLARTLDLVRDSPRPLYQQVAGRVRELIRTGRWPAHYRLKPEAELAGELGLARGTLRQAIRTLVNEGLLVQTRGKGTFVTAGATDLPLAERFVSMHEILAASGQEFHTEVLGQETGRGSDRIRSLLDVDGDELLLCLRRRMVVGGEPFVALDNYVRLGICPGVEGVDFTRETIFSALEGRFGLEIRSGQRSFAATRAGAQAELLGTTQDEPVLYLEQITYLADERPLEYSDVWIRGEKLRVTTHLRR